MSADLPSGAYASLRLPVRGFAPLHHLFFGIRRRRLGLGCSRRCSLCARTVWVSDSSLRLKDRHVFCCSATNTATERISSLQAARWLTISSAQLAYALSAWLPACAARALDVVSVVTDREQSALSCACGHRARA